MNKIMKKSYIALVPLIYIITVGQPVFSQQAESQPMQAVEPSAGTSAEPQIIKAAVPAKNNYDKKKLKMMQKISVYEGKIDNQKAILNAFSAIREKKIEKLQNILNKYESKLSMITRENKLYKIQLKINKIKADISLMKGEIGLFKEKIYKIIQKHEQKISQLEPY